MAVGHGVVFEINLAGNYRVHRGAVWAGATFCGGVSRATGSAACVS
jgi:hypothetical protein